MAKKAVLIGVNRYRVPGADLRGCVPDVNNMSNLLQRQYGFDAADITMLTDFDATKKAIEEAITGLISGGKRGDVLLLHYSGHGSNVPDDNNDEEPTTVTRSSVRPISTGTTHCATTGCAASSTA